MNLRKFVSSAVVAAFALVGLPAASNAIPAPLSPVHYTRLDFGGKTHYYVDFGQDMTYAGALTFASQNSFKGLSGGHLVTITSQDENDAVSRLVNLGGNSIWLPLKDTVHNSNAGTPRKFAWAAGPENGVTVTECGDWQDSYSCDDKTGSNWAEDEPNNAGGYEDVVEMYTNGEWNDTSANQCYDWEFDEWYGCTPTRATVFEYEANSVAAPASTPDAVTNVTVNSTVVGANISWTAPVYDGGSDVTYDVVVLDSAEAIGCTASETTSCAVSGLSPETAYDFTVTAVAGGSSSSAVRGSFTTKSMTVALPADDFTIVAAGPRGDVTFDTGINLSQGHVAHGVQWYFSSDHSWGFAPVGATLNKYECDTTPADGGGRLCWHTHDGILTGGWRAGNYTYLNGDSQKYRAVYTSDDPTYYPAGPRPNVTQAQITGGGWTLCFSNVYADATVPVSAILNYCPGKYLMLAGMAGPNDWTGLTAPGAPTDVAGVAGNGEATVSWSAPSSDGGAQVTGYTVTSSPGGKTCTTSGATSCTVTGLTNGTSYSFTVTASNAAGDSQASSSASATPFTVSDAPSGVSAVAGDGQATVSWSAPGFDGGSAITAYTVTASTGETCQTAIGVSLDFTSCTVDGLPNLQWLTFTVVASNAAGDSAASDATDRFVLHTDEFQVWLPDATVARDADAQVFVFGAMGVDTVKVRIGREVFEVTPDEFGTAVVDYNAGESSMAVAYGKMRVTATGVRVAEDGSKEKLRATGMFFAPKTTVRSRVRAGGQAVVRVRAANPGSSFSFRIDGVEVCTADADERGWVVCSFDAPEAGDYTVETFVGDLLTGSNDFTVLTGRRPV